MSVKIKFPMVVRAEGRNGYLKCTGIGIDQWQPDRIALYPFTSRDQPGRCEIQVPKDSILDLISALQEILNKDGNT